MLETTEGIYKFACASYSRTPNPDQAVAWEATLRGFRGDQVRRALLEWQRDTTEEFDGRTRGARFPTAADILKIAVRNKQTDRDVHHGTFTACGKDGCDDGWRRVTSGILASGKPVNPKDGAMQRCQCWWEFLAAYYNVPIGELQSFLTERRRQREKRASR